MSHAPNSRKSGSIITAAALIVGNLVGAGILGLPINTGLAGLAPSLLTMAAGAAMMAMTAIILGTLVAESPAPDVDYPTLYETFLGKAGKFLATAANLVILYGLMTAYFSGGATIVGQLTGFTGNSPVALLILAAPLIALTCIDISIIQRLNALFILLLLTMFLVLLTIGIGHVQPSRLSYADWSYLPSTLPIIITAFNFHNIIPTACIGLGRDKVRMRRAVLLGMGIALTMNGLWVLVGIGVIPLAGENSILAAWETNIPATVPMGVQLHSSVFVFCASVFALVAISTSFITTGLGMQGLLRDIMGNTFGIHNRALNYALTFAPPLLVALVYPDIFLKALDVVGGVGIVMLFCLPPIIIVLRGTAWPKVLRAVCALALVFSLFILATEIMQETGMLDLQPRVEYHKIDF